MFSTGIDLYSIAVCVYVNRETKMLSTVESYLVSYKERRCKFFLTQARVETSPGVAQPLPPTSLPKKPGPGDIINNVLLLNHHQLGVSDKTFISITIIF